MNLSSKENEDYRNYYDKKQVNYYVDLVDAPLPKAFLDDKKALLGKVLKNYFNGTPKKYLDVACGYGRLTKFFEDKVEMPHGVDVSESMLQIAKKKCENTRFYKRDITKNSLKKKFNLITSFRFFVNAQPSLKRNMVKAIRKHIKNGGLFIFNIHKNKTIPVRLFSWMQKLIYNKKVNMISKKEVERIIHKQFKIVDCIGMDYLGFGRITFIKNSFLIGLIINIDRLLRRILPATWATNVIYISMPVKN